MTPVPVGYKLCEEGEEIKLGCIVYSGFLWWESGEYVGHKWQEEFFCPTANPIVKSEEKPDDNLGNIVKAAVKLNAINSTHKCVPNYEIDALNKETGLDWGTLIKIRDIVQGG